MNEGLTAILLSEPVNQVAFAVMGLLLLETFVVGAWNEVLCHRAMAARAEILARGRQEPPDREAFERLRRAVRAFLDEDLVRLRGVLGLLEEVGPIAGLLGTFGGFVLALPGFWSALATAPDELFGKMGLAMGTSFLGMIVRLVALVAGHRLDTETDLLAASLARVSKSQQEGSEK